MIMKRARECKISENIEDINKKEIHNAIKEENYDQAERLLQEYKEKFTAYDDVIAIFDAGIGEYYGDRKRVWESIRKGLMFNSKNYELYVHALFKNRKTSVKEGRVFIRQLTY